MVEVQKSQESPSLGELEREVRKRFESGSSDPKHKSELNGLLDELISREDHH